MSAAEPLFHPWMGMALPDAALALRLRVARFMVMLFGGVGTLLARALPIGGLALLASAAVPRVMPAGDGRAQPLWPLAVAGGAFTLIYTVALRLVAPAETRALLARARSLRPF